MYADEHTSFGNLKTYTWPDLHLPIRILSLKIWWTPLFHGCWIYLLVCPKKIYIYLKIYKPGFITFQLCRCTQTLTLNASTKHTSRSNTRSSTTRVQAADWVDSSQQYFTHLEATKNEPQVKNLDQKKGPRTRGKRTQKCWDKSIQSDAVKWKSTAGAQGR